MRIAAVTLLLLPVLWGCRKESAPPTHADVAGVVPGITVDAADMPAPAAPAPATDVAPLGDDAVSRWKIKPGDARRVFGEYAPSTGFPLRAVAAEAMCAVRRAEQTLGLDGDSLRAQLGREYGLATEDERLGFLRAEIDAVRRYEVDLLRATRAWLADPSGATDDLDRYVAEVKRDPKAYPILSLVAIPLDRRLNELAEARARYLTFVQGGS